MKGKSEQRERLQRLGQRVESDDHHGEMMVCEELCRQEEHPLMLFLRDDSR